MSIDDLSPDGRHARRDRNRHAVVDAYLDLIRAGVPHPSVADVADRSGVSHRSVFRYFSDKEELARTAIERHYAHIRPLLDLTAAPTDPVPRRVDLFVERRLELYDEIAPVARLSRSLILTQPVIADGIDALRARLRQQIEHLFADELARTSDPAATLAAIDVICSFESFELLRHDQRLDRRTTAHVLTASVHRLLGT